MSEPALSPEQRLRCAVAHLCDGVDQHIIATLMGVNQGRIAEACVALRLAASDPKAATELLRASGRFNG